MDILILKEFKENLNKSQKQEFGTNKKRKGIEMKKLLLGTIVTICCLNAVAKNNEVIKLNNSSRQVVADKIDENLEKTLDFSQSNIIGSEALKELKKSSTNEDNETSENILVPLK